jgi:hypothetical protein
MLPPPRPTRRPTQPSPRLITCSPSPSPTISALLGGEGPPPATPFSITFNLDPAKDTIRGTSIFTAGDSHADEAVCADDPQG